MEGLWRGGTVFCMEDRQDSKPRILTLEGIVERGQIRLKDKVQLPESTLVYVIVPNIRVDQVARIYSPHLADKKQAADFKMEIVETRPDASI